jgi:hypothetical protein
VKSFERQPRGAAVHRTGRGGFLGKEPKIRNAVSILDTAPQPALGGASPGFATAPETSFTLVGFT